MGSANNKWRYIATSFLIGWTHTEDSSCVHINHTDRSVWDKQYFNRWSIKLIFSYIKQEYINGFMQRWSILIQVKAFCLMQAIRRINTSILVAFTWGRFHRKLSEKINFDSGNRLLLASFKPLPRQMLTSQEQVPVVLQRICSNNQSLAFRQSNRPISHIRAPSGGLSRTIGKLWQDYSNCYMFWT